MRKKGANMYESFANDQIFYVQNFGGLAQLARAPALQAGGHRFDSDILHHNPFEHKII